MRGKIIVAVVMMCAVSLIPWSHLTHAGVDTYTWRHAAINGGGGAFETDGSTGPYSGSTSIGQGQAIGIVVGNNAPYKSVYGFQSIHLRGPIEDEIFRDRFEQ